jgi:hypothetical protein
LRDIEDMALMCVNNADIAEEADIAFASALNQPNCDTRCPESFPSRKQKARRNGQALLGLPT